MAFAATSNLGGYLRAPRWKGSIACCQGTVLRKRLCGVGTMGIPKRTLFVLGPRLRPVVFHSFRVCALQRRV